MAEGCKRCQTRVRGGRDNTTESVLMPQIRHIILSWPLSLMNMKLALSLLVSSVLWVAPPTLGTAKYKFVVEHFHGIDFNNYTYPYKFSWGRNVRVTLKNGQYEYDLKM